MQTSKGDASFIHNKQMNGHAQLLTVVYEVISMDYKNPNHFKSAEKT
jgi:hypothetical protein